VASALPAVRRLRPRAGRRAAPPSPRPAALRRRMKTVRTSSLARRAVSHRFARMRCAAPNRAHWHRPYAVGHFVITARIRLIVLEHASTAAFTPAGERSRFTQSA
jgi:hypothetical protein